MLGDGDGEEVGTINIDAPELAHAIDRVVDGIEVLGKAGRSDEVVNLAMGINYLSDALFDGSGIRDVGIVGSDVGYTAERLGVMRFHRRSVSLSNLRLGFWVLPLESFSQVLGLKLSFFLCLLSVPSSSNENTDELTVQINNSKMTARVDHALAHDQT